MAAPVNRFVMSLTTNGDTLADRYEQTMLRLEQITRAGYQVKVQWECVFDEAGKDARTARAPSSVLVTCVPGTLCTGAVPRPCAYTIRRGKARLSCTWL